jgi:hypothetical protein
MILRQTATKVAATLAQKEGGGPIDFWQNVMTLIQFYRTGALPIVPTPQLGDVNREQPPPHGDDDIPF